MLKFGIAAILFLEMTAFAVAADDLESAFKDGRFEGRLRSQYFDTMWDDNSVATGRGTADGVGLAAGGSLIYKTAPLYGLSIGAGLYTTQNPGGITDGEDGAGATTSLDLFSRDSHYEGETKVADTYGTGYAVLAQSYLEYGIEKSKIKAGRFLMKNPWITPNDTKMIPIAVGGAQAVSDDVESTAIELHYANQFKERGMSYFGNMADTGDVPNAIRKHYNTHYNPASLDQESDAPDLVIAGVKNRSFDGLDLQAWGMRWNDLIDQLRLEANYALEAGAVILGFGGLYMQQFDQGAGALINPMTNNGDDDNSIDTSLWALRATADYRALRFLLSASQTSEDGDLIAGWRGFPTYDYTRSMTITDWNANTKGYKALIEYDFAEMVSGFKTILSYSYYDRDPSKKPYVSATDRGFQNGDTNQWNLDLIYQLAGSLKGTELKARFMDQKNDTTPTYPKELSNREVRLEINYYF